jgi:nicotinamide-nucleotide amidase
VRIQLSTEAKNREEAYQRLDPIYHKLKKQFSDYFYEAKSGKIEEAVLEELIQEKKTLIAAESCSGGAFSQKLTTLPNASLCFLGSCVTYSNALKKKILQVSENTLQSQGAVSMQTVHEMLEGLFLIADADYAVAISGLAGPSGGTADKPVGTVFIGIAKRGEKPDIGKVQGIWDRSGNIEYSVNVALSALWRKLSKNKPTFS